MNNLLRHQKSPRALTTTETLVALFILAVAVATLISSHVFSLMMIKVRQQQTMSNARQLYTATSMMNLDNATLGNPVRFTCSNTAPLEFAQWTNLLVSRNYLSHRDLTQLLMTPGPHSDTPVPAFTVFAVADVDPADTLFLATKNWPHSQQHPHGATNTLDTENFIVLNKSGYSSFLRPDQASSQNLIGSGGMHNYLPLAGNE